ncbi:hypothetical protein O181_029788 [Austropuccinia psidii MF-1]|uniref:Uncharacterized protein n=1 Tax=Austropuccinia psidii MF-1 TaxID=1389203 RepID=A0A9Q3H325_9BASI|nr:hypothetical protein [Austropuccinia psidii MF-1]
MNSFLQVKKFLGPEQKKRPYEGLDTHVLQRTSPKGKSLVEKPKHFVRGPEERGGTKEGQQPCGSSSSLQITQCQKRELPSTSKKFPD